MPTPNETKTPSTQIDINIEKRNPITFLGNQVVGYRAVDDITSYMKGLELADLLVNQKNAEIERQNVNAQPVENKVGA